MTPTELQEVLERVIGDCGSICTDGIAKAVLDSGLLVDAELLRLAEKSASIHFTFRKTFEAEVTRLRAENVKATDEAAHLLEQYEAAESRLARMQEALCQIEGALNDNFAKPEYETLGRVREIIDATLALPAETTPEVSCTCPGRRVPQHLPNCPLGAETKGTRKP